jgi:hypothetical protein
MMPEKLMTSHVRSYLYRSGGTWRRPPSGTFTLEFEYGFIVACLMVVQVIVYIVLCVVCCVCVGTIEHLFYSVSCCVTLLFKLLSRLSCFVSVAFVFVGAIFCETVMGLDSVASCFVQVLLFETRLLIAF